MDNKVYTREELEGLESWRATFRIKMSLSWSNDLIICLMKTRKGYYWKKPAIASCTSIDLAKFFADYDAGRLVLLSGTVPRRVKPKSTSLRHGLVEESGG